MESLPLLAKSRVFPNLDVTPLIREIFQTEFESCVPCKKLSENLRKSLEYDRLRDELEDEKSFRSVSYLKNLPDEKGRLLDYAERIFQAYGKHEEALDKIAKVELNIMETQAIYLKREEIIRNNDHIYDLLLLKRHPLMRPYDPKYVKQYKLLQGDSGLPPKHEANLDFRFNEYHRWKKRLTSLSQDSLIMSYFGNRSLKAKAEDKQHRPKLRKDRPKKPQRARAIGERKMNVDVFRAEPPTVCFMDCFPGQTYEYRVVVQNVSSKPMKFSVKPLTPGSPFRVEVYGKETARILPGRRFKLRISFTPTTTDEENENLTLRVEDGSSLVIPLASYLEPPVLTSCFEPTEETKAAQEKVQSTYIDCGTCFPGDSKVTKIRLCSCGGAGEFFIMSSDNWNDWHVNSLTADNFTDIPPFRLYPSYFSLDKNQVFDLYLEFKPTTPGLHSDNIVICCSNGEIRNLDILGDGMTWNRAFISFQDTMEKDFPAHICDDQAAVYYLDAGSSLSTGHIERSFLILNNCEMPFDFRWEMRDFQTGQYTRESFHQLSKDEVKIEPSSGTFEPSCVRKFHVSITFKRSLVGKYRKVLSLYIVGLPYESIEQASTIIRPSILRGRFKSGSLFGEEENFILSPEMSYQGTLESIRENMKAPSSELKYQEQFPSTVCQKHPEICAIPLKDSGASSNISEGGARCTCKPLMSETERPKNGSRGREFFPRKEKPNITELGSDLLWDFVDVLVDEVELWAEVLPTVVLLEPNIINLFANIRPKEPPREFTVDVRNCTDFPIKCRWGKPKVEESKMEEEISTLYHIGEDSRTTLEDCGESNVTWQDISAYDDEDDDGHMASYTVKNNQDEKIEPSANKYCCIRAEPSGDFQVPSRSIVSCTIYISVTKPGIVNRTIQVTIVDHLRVSLPIIGRVPDGDFAVMPRELDFRVRRRGTRYAKHFKIRNCSLDSLKWQLEEFKYDFDKRCLVGPVNQEEQSSLKDFDGVIDAEDCIINSYKLDARKEGLQMSLLRFRRACPALADTSSKYVLVLSDVQTPKLAVEAPRFSNAILAPCQTMYVGQPISKTVILRNTKHFATPFVWGNPFGCHCNMLGIIMTPKLCVVPKRNIVNVQVSIIPLKEGIIEHCYIPGFFSRNARPIFLSVVGVVKNLEVTFLLTERSVKPYDTENKQTPEKFSFRIPWPIRDFDPSIGKTHLQEVDILNFACHCDRVESEYCKSVAECKGGFDELEGDTDEDIKYPGEVWDEGEDYNPEGEPCMVKYYPHNKNMLEHRSISQKQPKDGDVAEETEEVEGERSHDTDSLCTLPSDSQDSDSALSECSKNSKCIHLMQYFASEIQFLNVPHKTVASRQFVIRNESPIEAKFALRVIYFMKNDTSGCDKLDIVKRRIAGCTTDNWEKDLMPGQPLLISVSPAEGTLKAWEARKVNVSVYGNTWGEYRDFIVCNLQGLPPFVLKILVQLSGHPILFPMFSISTLDLPVLRFNTVKYKSAPVMRTISVRNTSCIPITVTWMIFLTSPLSDDTRSEPFNLCLDLYTDKESEDTGKTTKSSHNYLSKNTSGSNPLLSMTDMDKASWCTGIENVSEPGTKNASPQMRPCSMVPEDELPPLTMLDSTRPEIQLLEYYGKMDLHVFKIYPRELDFEAFGTEKITIIFDPNYYEQSATSNHLQEFQAVATGCVRLRQEYAHYPDIYHRPCGNDYVSKLILMSAFVERPLLTFDVKKCDLRYTLDANQVLQVPACKFTRKYLVVNNNETAVTIQLRMEPGEIFSVKQVDTPSRTYEKFDPTRHTITIQPGNTIQVELEMTITKEQVVDIYNKMQRNQKPCHEIISRDSSELMSQGEVIPADRRGRTAVEFSVQDRDYATEAPSILMERKFFLKPRDSVLITKFRSRHWKNTISISDFPCDYPTSYYPQEPGEGWDYDTLAPDGDFILKEDEDICIHVVKEDLVFEQVDLHTQVLTPELLIFFPSLKIQPKDISFGKVYMGETSRRYISIINMIQFPTTFTVLMSGYCKEIEVYPNKGSVPAANYKADTGVDLVVEFTPQKPGLYKTSLRIYGNEDMEFRAGLVTVWGFGTWNESNKYPKLDATPKLPPIRPV